MKKIAFLTCILLCLAFSVKSQKLYVSGTDNGNPSPDNLDYWEITYVVVQYNTAHTSIIATWQGDQLNPSVHPLNCYSASSFNELCPFTISGNLPDIGTPDFRVLVSVKRYYFLGLTYLCGYQSFSGWMDEYDLLHTPFYVSGTLN
jgi:hypothetical protein